METTRENKAPEQQTLLKESSPEDQTSLEEQAREERSRHIREYKKSIRRSILLALTALITIIFVCIAWFINNSRVNLNGIQIQGADDGFELASEGTDGGWYETLLKDSSLDWNTVWSTGESVLYSFTGKQTSGSSQQINWMMSASSNFNNNKTGSSIEDDEPGIFPGTSGKLTFYVIPARDGTMTLQFDLTTELYKKAGNQLDNLEEDKNDTAAQTAVRLFSGHLLFFLKKSDTTGLYSDWIEDGTFSVTFTNAEKEKKYPVTIYWVWPYVFSQTLLPKGSVNLNGNAVLFEDDVRKAMMKDMLSNREKYFYNNYSGMDLSEIITQDILQSMVDGTYMAMHYTELSRYFNQADQVIGEQIQYVLLRLNASTS